MKLILIFCLFSITLLANPKKYMVCLGKEEATIHKQKIGGAHYKLNQEIIAALLQLRTSIEMKANYEDVICNSISPSIKTLELLMSKDLFYSIHSKENNLSSYQIDQMALKDLEYKSAELFIGFVTGLQAALPKANCLQKLVPELDIFFEKMQYILEDVGIERVMSTIKSPAKTFKKLSMINLNKPKC
jgi:hypothetical protein